MMWISIYPPQWQNTTLRHSGLPNWPMLQGRDCVPPHPQAMGPGATLCRTVPLLTEVGSSKISFRPLSRFGSHQILDNE